MRTKILFLIHDLGQGGAEKALVSLVNHMNKSQFDITVISLFGGGVNEQYINDDIHYSYVYKRMIPANSKWMKLYTPEQLHKKYIKEKYDIEISFLEGPCTRIISGCKDPNTKLISWIHCTLNSEEAVSLPFRNPKEARDCYNAMNRIIFVSEGTKKRFIENCRYEGNTQVLYNVLNTEEIINAAQEHIDEMPSDRIKLISIGTLKPVKGFDRLLRVVKRLNDESYPIKLYILGEGPMRGKLERYIKENSLESVVSLLGYKRNPYKYLSKCDLFVCSSYSEGLSTAVSEALLLGVPVCTVEVSGMKELLEGDGEIGIMTKNTEEDLYKGLKMLFNEPEKLAYYKSQLAHKRDFFKTESSVNNIEKMLLSVLGG